MNTQRLLVAAIGVVAFSMTAFAADWPQWRGPERTGLSKETGLLKEWPKDGPKLVWQVKTLGDGYSTPAIAAGRIYLLADRDKEEFAVALDTKDGKEIWSIKLGKVGANGQPDYSGARSTPTVDGEMLYCLSSDGDLVCLECAKGKELWRKNLKTDFKGKPGRWAYAESPLIDGDVLVCTPGGEKATLVALNKKNGEVIWKSEIPTGDDAAYASVTVAEIGGVKQYVQFLAKGVVGVDAKTGKFLWRYGKTAEGSLANIPTPVAHDGYVFSSSGQGGAGLVKLKGKDGAFETEQVYFLKTLPTSIGGVVRIGDYLYGTTRKELQCVEFTTGKVLWHNDCVAAGSVCYADGRLYIHGENDEVALVEATPDAYRELGHFKLPDQPKHKQGMEKAWAYPVVANGRLYLRDLNMLWCYNIKGEK